MTPADTLVPGWAVEQGLGQVDASLNGVILNCRLRASRVSFAWEIRVDPGDSPRDPGVMVTLPLIFTEGPETMKTLASVLITGASVLAIQAVAQTKSETKAEQKMAEVAAATYEHLATAIIEIERTEDELVKSIILGYHAAAKGHLHAAAAAGDAKHAHLEAAATEIANIANEGDKRIQAIRQRLAKAGHTHNTDVVTKEDFMFVDSKEKKELVALSRKVAGFGNATSANDVLEVQKELDALFAKVIAEE
ncbi:hypothetical protein [Singulisphaera sp. PoT]|uniref:hypothetical protein n=1 Tax=Singulisphaera sp. PoT TaxID=3411797 RepID=UPI003BF55E39